MLTTLLVVLALLIAQPTSPANPDANAAAIAKARTDAGWIQRNASFNARAKQGREQGDIGVIFLGDSITQGWETNGKGTWESRYASRQAVNLGIGGDRTQHVLWRIEHGNLEGLGKPEKGHAPTLVVLMIGTNNLGSDSPEQIAGGIGAIVESLGKRLPGTPVLLLGVFPRGEHAADPARERIAEINRRAAKLADGKRVTFLDIGARFVGADGSISKEIMPDFLHLSPKGYEIWGEAIEPDVKRLLGEPAEPPKP